MKKIYFALQLLFLSVIGIAQNWSNVGTPFLTTGTTSGGFLYFGDMEIDASGTVYVGYWDNGGKLNVAKNVGTTWTILPSPGKFAVSFDDLELYGTDIYISYMGVRGSNLYAYVKKYDGSATWNFIGDSILIGGVGQGGSFDFLLDKNGVPTIIGIQNAAFQNKTVKQFIAGAWSTTYIIPNTTSSIFKDGSAKFDANNKLNCIAGGLLTLSGPPYIKYYTLGIKIDGATSSVIADTIFASIGNGQFRIDNAGNSYLLFNDALKPSYLSYKLNGAKWDMVSDTVGAKESMLYTDVSSDGKIVFNTNAFVNMHKSIYQYNAGARIKMDSINYNGLVAAVSDIVIYNNEVYALFQEMSGVSSGYTVMKHSLNGSSSAISPITKTKDYVSIYPNPASNVLTITNQLNDPLFAAILNINGQKMLEQTLNESTNKMDISSLNPGLYFVLTTTKEGNTNTFKIIVE